MLEQAYLVKGLTALARAMDYSWNQGHFGCAVITGYLLCKEQALDADSEASFQSELDHLFFLRPHLFEPLPASAADPEAADRVALALEATIDSLCPGGHNVIYGALGIRALCELPALATKSAADGLCRLISAFEDLPQDLACEPRDERGRPVSLQDASRGYTGLDEMATLTFEEILRYEPMYYEIQGRVGHLVTHAQALVELARAGYGDLAKRGFAAHRKHVWAVRANHLEDQRYWPVVPASDVDPLDQDSWEPDRPRMHKSEWGYGHFFKYRFQFLDLLRLVDDEGLRRRVHARLPEFLMNESTRIGERLSPG